MPDYRKIAAKSGDALVTKVLTTGLDGAGPFKGAKALAEEALRHEGGSVEEAVDRVVKLHVRLAGVEGFATGLPGGGAALVAVPTDLTAFYLLAGRMTGAVAHLRGYDIRDETVRSAILISMLGSSGAQLLKSVGVEVGAKGAMAALKKLPGKLLIEINKKVGFRLITKFGEKGVINLGKLVPLVGGPIGLVTNVASMRTIGAFAKIMLPTVPPAVGDAPSSKALTS